MHWMILKRNGKPLLHSLATTENVSWEMALKNVRIPIEGLHGVRRKMTRKEAKGLGLKSQAYEIIKKPC